MRHYIDYTVQAVMPSSYGSIHIPVKTAALINEEIEKMGVLYEYNPFYGVFRWRARENWRDFKNDMLLLSKKIPGVLFYLDCDEWESWESNVHRPQYQFIDGKFYFSIGAGGFDLAKFKTPVKYAKKYSHQDKITEVMSFLKCKLKHTRRKHKSARHNV